MHINQISLTNFKSFKKVVLTDIPAYAVFVGANGVGKTTLFDLFGFLKDCLKDDVTAALAKHGGFRQVVSRGIINEPISIEIKMRMNLSIGPRTVTYKLVISEESGTPIVASERLRYTRFGGGKPFDFLHFIKGSGTAIIDAVASEDDSAKARDFQKLDRPDILAIKGLGQFQKFEAANEFRKLIENWHVSDFKIDAARQVRDAGYAEHLTSEGDNLALVAQFLYARHRSVFSDVLRKMAVRVPGVEKVEAQETIDGRIVLQFKDSAFSDPFIARHVSDGTIKMFAYLLLLHDPRPHQLLCVEEPENQLYVSLMGGLSEEFAEYARKGGQVFVSTHSPDFLNAVPLESIFLLSKKEGATTIRRARDDENLRSLIQAGDLPGDLWRQQLFEGVDP